MLGGEDKGRAIKLSELDFQGLPLGEMWENLGGKLVPEGRRFRGHRSGVCNHKFDFLALGLFASAFFETRLGD
jgi:hypothetical protein